jgi:hypothetical protein
MAYTPHPTVTVGQVWHDTDQNTYVKGNLDALFPYANALEVSYSTSTASLNKARALAALNFLQSNLTNTSIDFSGLFYARQGNSTVNWFSTSTSTTLANYTSLNSVKFQCGTYNWTGLSGFSGGGNVIFPSAYTNIPTVIVASISTFSPVTGLGMTPTIYSITSTNFWVQVFPASTTTGINNMVWMSFGI